MNVIHRRGWEIPEHQATPEGVFLNRRALLTAGAGLAAATLVPGIANAQRVTDIPDPTNPENLLKANGRGILFMNAFMDEVSWTNHESGGMVVRMVKKR